MRPCCGGALEEDNSPATQEPFSVVGKFLINDFTRIARVIRLTIFHNVYTRVRTRTRCRGVLSFGASLDGTEYEEDIRGGSGRGRSDVCYATIIYIYIMMIA